MTKIQITTLIAYTLFIAYEAYLMSLSESTNIRIDLVIFPPILVILTLLSLYQYFSKR